MKKRRENEKRRDTERSAREGRGESGRLGLGGCGSGGDKALDLEAELEQDGEHILFRDRLGDDGREECSRLRHGAVVLRQTRDRHDRRLKVGSRDRLEIPGDMVRVEMREPKIEEEDVERAGGGNGKSVGPVGDGRALDPELLEDPFCDLETDGVVLGE